MTLEQTINNFKESEERLPPNEILFQRVLERLIIDEIFCKQKNLE